MLIQSLVTKGLMHPPSWLPSNTQYLTVMGSTAYGVSTDNSDLDIYGWVIPPQSYTFPHLAGVIQGFGRQIEKFEQYQQHHILDKQARGGHGQNYDFSIYSIVRYFHLLMENNPNMVDSLFVRQEDVIHCTQMAQLVRDNRKMFLHKGLFHKYKGYAFSQLHKMNSKEPTKDSNRDKLRQEFGFDVKFAYHVVRLLSQAEQMLVEGDLDLKEEGRREHMKAIRRGDIKETEIRTWFSDKERQLEKLYHESKLPYGPDEDKIKQLLLNILEHHYGSLEKCITVPEQESKCLAEINLILRKFGMDKL